MLCSRFWTETGTVALRYGRSELAISASRRLHPYLSCSALQSGSDASTATMADAAGPPPRGKNLVKVAEVAYAMKKRALEERDEAHANAEKQQKTLTAIAE